MDRLLVLTGLSEASPALLAVVISTAIMFAAALTFLVAAARLRRSNSRKAALWARLEMNWGATIDCISRGSAGEEELHRRVRGADRAVLVDYLYKSSLREERPARRAMYHRLAEPYLGVLEERARTGDIWQRARAVRTLGELAGDEAAPIILAALEDDAPHVAMTAAREYTRLRLGGVEALLDRLDRYRTWDRRLLRSMLASFGAAAAPQLRVRLENEAQPAYARAVCADALADLLRDGVATAASVATADLAATVLQREEDVDLLAASLRLLQATPGPTPRPASQREAVRRLCHAENDVVRGQAVACLARIGDEDDLTLVDRSLADLSPWVARSASLGLAMRNDLMDTSIRGVPVLAPDPLVIAGMGAEAEDGSDADDGVFPGGRK
ncbi:MAG TPA: hypothetical protein VK929_12690 [Longimicrobiales bacterium]|nr:hypothetical protein [Longimicrobiales bacterium]